MDLSPLVFSPSTTAIQFVHSVWYAWQAPFSPSIEPKAFLPSRAVCQATFSSLQQALLLPLYLPYSPEVSHLMTK